MELLRDVRDVNSEMRNAELRNERHRSKIIPYVTMHFMVFCKCIIFQTYTISFLENWCIFPSTLLQVRLLRREYNCCCECSCLPLHSTGATTCWIDSGGFAPLSMKNMLLRDLDILLQQTLFMLLDHKEMQRTL